MVLLEIQEQIEKIKSRRGIKGHLASKSVINDYRTYLKWRGLLKWDTGIRPRVGGHISRSVIFRERDQIFPFHGTKCKACGNIQYPPHRICINCFAKDQFEPFRLSDQRGKVATFAMDYVTSDLDLPLVMAMVDFDVGARFYTSLTDKLAEGLKVGMPVEMTFRKLFSTEDMHQYFWKAMPLRA